MTQQPKSGREPDTVVAERVQLLNTLDHLIYVFEALASGLTGEAKFELSRLIDDVERSTLPDKGRLLTELNESQKFLRAMQYVYAATPLSRVREILWKELRANVVPGA